MGWFGNLFGRKPEAGFTRFEGDGSFECDVVGESNYQDALNRIAGGKTEDGHEFECTARLVPEPGNPHDSNAVMVMIDGRQVGYLSRAHAQAMTILFQRKGLGGAEADALVVGGWKRGRGAKDEGHYGVKLDLPI